MFHKEPPFLDGQVEAQRGSVPFLKPHSQQEARTQSDSRCIWSQGLSANRASCPCVTASEDRGQAATSPPTQRRQATAGCVAVRGLSKLEKWVPHPWENGPGGGREPGRWGLLVGPHAVHAGVRKTVSPPKSPRDLVTGQGNGLSSPALCSIWGCPHPASSPAGPLSLLPPVPSWAVSC